MPTTDALTTTDVTDDSFQAEVLESELPVVVDFWAAWCGPCRVMSPILEELAAERDDLRVVKVDVDANQRVSAEYGVLGMPTFMVFRDGAPVGSIVGSRPKRRLLEDVETLLSL
jgi:thioredoxin 1